MPEYGIRLFSNHQEELTASAISIEDSEGAVSVDTKARLEDLGFTFSQQLVPGCLFRSTTVDNTFTYQYKPDKPRKDEKTFKPIKYETPRGQAVRLDVPISVLPIMYDPFIDIVVTEGWKKVRSLLSAGFYAVGLQGVSCWGKQTPDGRKLHDDWRHFILKGRKVYICFDSDVVDKESVRHELREFSRQLTKAGALVRVLRIPSIDPEEKIGIDDWLAAGKMVADLPVLDVWQTLLPELRRVGIKPTDAQFPLVYPSAINSFVEKVVEDSGAKLAIVGPSLLPVIGTVAGSSVSVKVGPTWSESPTIWLAIVADSGSNKSPAFRPIVKPLKDIQKMYAGYNKAADDAWQQLPTATRGNPPPHQKIMIDDLTIEMLYRVLNDNPQGVLLFDDEIKGWVTSMDKYTQGESGERQRWLKIFNNEPIDYERVGRGSVPIRLFIERPYVCVMGGVQPELVSILSKGNDGLAPRFLFAISESDKVIKNPPHPNDAAPSYDDWGIALRRIHDLGKTQLTMASDVFESAWMPWYHLNQAKSHEAPEEMQYVYSKMQAYVWRFATNLHLLDYACEGTVLGEIDVDQFNRAVQLANWFEAQAQQIIGLNDGSNARDHEYSMQLDKLHNWILKHPHCSRSNVLQSGPAFARNGKKLTEMLKDLNISL